MISKSLRNYFLIMLFGAIIVALIGYYYTQKDLPPYPAEIVSESGEVISGHDRIKAGQKVWQKYGLMDLGSVWGHGTYRGPDFTAQALHQMVLNMRRKMAREEYDQAYDMLSTTDKGAIDAAVIEQIKTNRYQADRDRLVLTDLQVYALKQNRLFYDTLFSQGAKDTPIRAGAIKSEVESRNLADFFFWTAWCAGTIRPGDEHTYTNIGHLAFHPPFLVSLPVSLRRLDGTAGDAQPRPCPPESGSMWSMRPLFKGMPASDRCHAPPQRLPSGLFRVPGLHRRLSPLGCPCL